MAIVIVVLLGRKKLIIEITRENDCVEHDVLELRDAYRMVVGNTVQMSLFIKRWPVELLGLTVICNIMLGACIPDDWWHSVLMSLYNGKIFVWVA